MIIHPLSDDGSVPIQKMDPPAETQQVPADTASAYDTTWTEVPDTGRADGLNRIMGADGKIYVVLAVVLIIWFGVLALLVRTDRKIDMLERRLDQASSERDRDE